MAVLELIMFAFGFVLTILFWFVRTRDDARAKSINLLFRKHDEDVEKLQELKIIIAGRHYERGELDIKFEKLEHTFKEGFNTLGDRFDNLSKVLIEQAGK
jgi:hypothetical protein